MKNEGYELTTLHDELIQLASKKSPSLDSLEKVKYIFLKIFDKLKGSNGSSLYTLFDYIFDDALVITKQLCPECIERFEYESLRNKILIDGILNMEKNPDESDANFEYRKFEQLKLSVVPPAVKLEPLKGIFLRTYILTSNPDVFKEYQYQISSMASTLSTLVKSFPNKELISILNFYYEHERIFSIESFSGDEISNWTLQISSLCNCLNEHSLKYIKENSMEFIAVIKTIRDCFSLMLRNLSNRWVGDNYYLEFSLNYEKVYLSVMGVCQKLSSLSKKSELYIPLHDLNLLISRYHLEPIISEKHKEVPLLNQTYNKMFSILMDSNRTLPEIVEKIGELFLETIINCSYMEEEEFKKSKLALIRLYAVILYLSDRIKCLSDRSRKKKLLEMKVNQLESMYLMLVQSYENQDNDIKVQSFTSLN